MYLCWWKPHVCKGSCGWDPLEMGLHVVVNQLSLGPLEEQQQEVLTNKPFLQPSQVPGYFHVGSGYQIQNSCLHEKHFTDWESSKLCASVYMCVYV